VNLPVGWTYTSCDNSFCYGGVPIGPNVMDSVSIGGQGFVGVDIDPANISGVGTVKIYVYQEGYYSQGDTLTSNISTTAVGVEEISESSGISIYPNPTSDFLHIDFDVDKAVSSAYLTDNIGRLIRSIEVSETTSSIDISDLKIGYYNLVFETKGEFCLRKYLKPTNR
jgi:Secretion system C-terminal sorting domain